ncbi:trypsin-like serine protease [Methylobacterium sp. WSM2598]|uniref:trypsin-like serine protease n=1 Tax=Methylobacterium sp. WSM2598 TaxID=398261 RepID=UPI000381753C|nr:trypsin-like serine protease [Methylobacterium sp. WSM2598]
MPSATLLSLLAAAGRLAALAPAAAAGRLAALAPAAVAGRLAALAPAAVAGWLAALAPAAAVIGGRDDPGGPLAGSAVMVLSSRGGVCSGVVLAPTVVLTAGHCAAPGAEHRVHFRDGAGEPVLLPLAEAAVHPGFDPGAVAGRRRSIDLALLRLPAPLPARFAPAPLSAAPPRAGAALTLGGYGLARPRDPRSSGTYRVAALPAVEPHGPSRILVWLRAADGVAGACEGDSGGPITAADRVVAVTTWTSGPGGCGGFSQGVLLGPQRAWIDGILSRWSVVARWE